MKIIQKFDITINAGVRRGKKVLTLSTLKTSGNARDLPAVYEALGKHLEAMGNQAGILREGFGTVIHMMLTQQNPRYYLEPELKYVADIDQNNQNYVVEIKVATQKLFRIDAACV